MTLSLCLHLSSSVALSVPVMSLFVYTRMYLFVYLPLSPFHSLPTYFSIFISLPLYLSLPFSLSPISPSLHHLSISLSRSLVRSFSLYFIFLPISLLVRLYSLFLHSWYKYRLSQLYAEKRFSTG